MGRWRRRWRPVVASVLAGLVVTVVGYRVFAPAEVLTPARTPYPDVAEPSPPGVVGSLTAAPLIVDHRLRIYATTRQVRADGPVDAGTVRTPFWSYRRWPAQLAGVVAHGTTVVSRWSDGELVALDARTGRVAWRADGPRPDHGYAGRTTGAATVYAPPGLHTGTTRDGRPVVVVADPERLNGYDPATGRTLWTVDRTCAAAGFTSTSGLFVAACGSSEAVELHDLATGVATQWRPPDAPAVAEVTPVGCAPARSDCPAMRTASHGRTRGWLFDGPVPAAAPALDPPDAWLVGEVAVTVRVGLPRGGPAGKTPGGAGCLAVAYSARTGAELWRRAVPERTQVLAGQLDQAHLLTPDHDLITVDVASGGELSRFPLRHGDRVLAWTPGHVYASDGFVAVERISVRAAAGDGNVRYYAAIEPVLFARTAIGTGF